MFEDISEIIDSGEFMASEEIIKIDRALEESKKIQSSLESSIQQVKKLNLKYEAASYNYSYNFTPSKRLSHQCVRSEYLIFGIYDTHLSKLCRKIDQYSPQRSPQNRLHHRVRRIQYTPSSCSSSQSTSSNEQINQMELDEVTFDVKNHICCGNEDEKLDVRTHKDVIKVYNRTKTERIKSKREIEAALISLDKALTLSTNRAMEAKNYGWIRPKMSTTLKMYPARRSISTSMCRVKHSTPIQIRRPHSTSVMF